MRNLKVVIVVFLVCSNIALFANPPVSKANVKKAKQELYRAVRLNLNKGKVLHNIKGYDNMEFIVYAQVNSENELEVKRIVGDNNSLKERVVELMEEHPALASETLQGENISFRLRFQKKYKKGIE